MTLSDRLFDIEALPLRSTVTNPVMAATAWPDNATMVLDLARLGYLHSDWVTLDATYGRGLWWTRWRPSVLVTNDIDPRADTDWHADFRDLQALGALRFDVCVFDPPYISMGGRDTSTVPDFIDRYGLEDAPGTPSELQQQIHAGMTELARVTVAGGLILVKLKDYVDGGWVWHATHKATCHAEAIGLRLVDRLEHLSGTGPSSHARQVHARRNLSTLLVLQKPRRMR